MADEEILCPDCKKPFSTKGNLKMHRKSTKYCLKLRGIGKLDYVCKQCEKQFSRKHHFLRHNEICPAAIKSHYKEKLKNKDTIIMDLEKKITILNDEIAELKELSAERKGRIETYKDIGPKNNITINQRLAALPTDNIQPLTLEYVKSITSDPAKYTYTMFQNQPLGGLVKFICDMISFENEDGVMELNYTCTDVSRYKCHRLVKSTEWTVDNGAHFIKSILDDLREPVLTHYTYNVHKKRDSVDDFDFDWWSKNVEDTKPLYRGICFPKSKARESLFSKIRKKICQFAALPSSSLAVVKK